MIAVKPLTLRNWAHGIPVGPWDVLVGGTFRFRILLRYDGLNDFLEVFELEVCFTSSLAWILLGFLAPVR